MIYSKLIWFVISGNLERLLDLNAANLLSILSNGDRSLIVSLRIDVTNSLEERSLPTFPHVGKEGRETCDSRDDKEGCRYLKICLIVSPFK